MTAASRLVPASPPMTTSRRQLLAASLPAAACLGAGVGVSSAAPVAERLGAALPPCACAHASGPMRVVGWSAYRLP